MANQYKNKVIYFGDTLIDISDTTAIASVVASGYKFYGANGAPITGTSTLDADTSDGTITAASVLYGGIGYSQGNRIVGTMPNIGSQTGTISTKAQEIAISQGYHDGGGKVSISSTEQAKIIAGNIKSGVVILGVTGTYTGSELIKSVAGTITPSTTSQVYLPSSEGDYDYFTQVTVNAIPYTETDNAAGGVTVTIGTAA